MTELDKTLRLAIADPGAFTPRGENYHEPIHCWSARAVQIALRALPIDERVAAVGLRDGSVNDAGDADTDDHEHWWPEGRYESMRFYVDVATPLAGEVIGLCPCGQHPAVLVGSYRGAPMYSCENVSADTPILVHTRPS